MYTICLKNRKKTHIILIFKHVCTLLLKILEQKHSIQPKKQKKKYKSQFIADFFIHPPLF